MQNALIEIINDYGYLGILLLIFIENVFPPIPSEVVLVFGGFLTTRSDMRLSLVVLSATIGAVLGAVVLYSVGRLLDREKIKKLFSGKFGKAMRLQPNDVTRAETWFRRYEKRAVLICRCIPVVRSLISIPAGMAKMNLFSFFALTIIGTVVWNTLLVTVGALAGSAWEQSLKYLDLASSLVLAILAITAAVVAAVYVKKRFFSSKDGDDSTQD